jgi:hypothetical protein
MWWIKPAVNTAALSVLWLGTAVHTARFESRRFLTWALAPVLLHNSRTEAHCSVRCKSQTLATLYRDCHRIWNQLYKCAVGIQYQGEEGGVGGSQVHAVPKFFATFPPFQLFTFRNTFPCFSFPVSSILYLCILTCLKHAWRHIERQLVYRWLPSGAVFSSLPVSAMMRRLHALRRHVSCVAAGQWFDVFCGSNVRTFRRCCCQVREVLCAVLSSVYLNTRDCRFLFDIIKVTEGCGCDGLVMLHITAIRLLGSLVICCWLGVGWLTGFWLRG